MMSQEQQLDRLGNDIEGFLNDFEGGESTLEETKIGLAKYLFERIESALSNQWSDVKNDIAKLRNNLSPFINLAMMTIETPDKENIIDDCIENEAANIKNNDLISMINKIIKTIEDKLS